jgi:hypothetical protein
MILNKVDPDPMRDAPRKSQTDTRKVLAVTLVL